MSQGTVLHHKFLDADKAEKDKCTTETTTTPNPRLNENQAGGGKATTVIQGPYVLAVHIRLQPFSFLSLSKACIELIVCRPMFLIPVYRVFIKY